MFVIGFVIGVVLGVQLGVVVSAWLLLSTGTLRRELGQWFGEPELMLSKCSLHCLVTAVW